MDRSDNFLRFDCALDHDADGIERVRDALRLLSGRVDHFDGALHLLGEDNVWTRSDSELTDLRGAMSELDLCWQCVNGVGNAVRTRLAERGVGQESVLPVAFLRSGVPVVDMLPVAPEHRCTWRPTEELGAPPASVVRLSALEELVLVGALGLEECCCRLLLSWARRALACSQRQVPVVLAEPGAGKSTLIDALTWAVPRDAVTDVTGSMPDRYSGARMQLSAFVMVDEAQDLDKAGFSALKGVVGGGRRMLRAMRHVGPSRASRASVLLAAERDAMTFGRHWEGGWMDRARFFVGGQRPGLTREGREEVRSDRAYLAWRVLLAEPGEAFDECRHLQMGRSVVEAAMKTKHRRI